MDVSVEQNVSGNVQEHSFTNATLQTHGQLEFSVATHVVVPDWVTTEAELAGWLDTILRGICARNQEFSFEVQVGPAAELAPDHSVDLVTQAVNEVFGADHPRAVQDGFFVVEGSPADVGDWDRLVAVQTLLADVDIKLHIICASIDQVVDSGIPESEAPTLPPAVEPMAVWVHGVKQIPPTFEDWDEGRRLAYAQAEYDEAVAADGPAEYVVTETPDDPLNAWWVGHACNPVDALNRYVRSQGFAGYPRPTSDEDDFSVMPFAVDEEQTAFGACAVFTNTTLYALAVGMFDTPVLAQVLRHVQGTTLAPGETVSLEFDVVQPESVSDLDAESLRGAIRECRSMLRQLGEATRARPTSQSFVAWIELLIVSFTEALNSQKRSLATSPALCSSCGKRERRFGDLCGRCAETQGVRPKGKV